MKHSELKRLLPLPQLMNRAGLEAFAKLSCLSPFRESSAVTPTIERMLP